MLRVGAESSFSLRAQSMESHSSMGRKEEGCSFMKMSEIPGTMEVGLEQRSRTEVGSSNKDQRLESNQNHIQQLT